MTCVLEEVFDKRIFLERFNYGCEKYLTLNQITSVVTEMIPVTKKSEAPNIYTEPEEVVDLEK